jgi:SAM-dependent methyltransferase
MPSEEERHSQRYADAIRAARSGGTTTFQSWFNRAESIEEALRRGFWDFSVHILVPEVTARISDPGALTALEIGYGGGRLLNAAASFFGRVVGVDVHEEHEAVAALLASCGRDNVELIRTDGRTIPLPDESVDFAYSFIVLQHLDSVETFERYISETHRVLRRDGIAQLYFGRLATRNPLRRFREIAGAPVNHVSLELAPRAAARMCGRAGFQVIGRGISHKNVPDGYPDDVGGQSYVTLAKTAR